LRGEFTPTTAYIRADEPIPSQYVRSNQEGEITMKQSTFTLLLVLASASPSLQADTKADILAVEKASWQAAAKHDVKAYTDTMTSDATAVFAAGDVLQGAKAITDDNTSHPCDFKSFDFADVRLRQLTTDSAVLSYKATQDVTCAGKKLAPRVFATSVYVREGGKWRSVSYQETAIK